MKPTLPDARGHFGRFGGRFVPETLMAPLIELEQAWASAKRDRKFQRRLADLLRDYAGRPTPLYFAERLSEQCGGARIYPSARTSATPAHTDQQRARAGPAGRADGSGG